VEKYEVHTHFRPENLKVKVLGRLKFSWRDNVETNRKGIGYEGAKSKFLTLYRNNWSDLAKTALDI
jgi:hypothetical protein